jgi:hypothetical protein
MGRAHRPRLKRRATGWDNDHCNAAQQRCDADAAVAARYFFSLPLCSPGPSGHDALADACARRNLPVVFNYSNLCMWKMCMRTHKFGVWTHVFVHVYYLFIWELQSLVFSVHTRVVLGCRSIRCVGSSTLEYLSWEELSISDAHESEREVDWRARHCWLHVSTSASRWSWSTGPLTACSCVRRLGDVPPATFSAPRLMHGRRRPVVGLGPVVVGTVSRMEHDDESISHRLLVYETSIGSQPTPTGYSSLAPRQHHHQGVCRRGQVTYDISATATSTWARPLLGF